MSETAILYALDDCACGCHRGEYTIAGCEHCTATVSSTSTEMVRQILVDEAEWERLRARLSTARELLQALVEVASDHYTDSLYCMACTHVVRAEKWLEGQS